METQAFTNLLISLMAATYVLDYRKSDPATQARIADRLRHAKLVMRNGTSRAAVVKAMDTLGIEGYKPVPRIVPSMLAVKPERRMLNRW